VGYSDSTPAKVNNCIERISTVAQRFSCNTYFLRIFVWVHWVCLYSWFDEIGLWNDESVHVIRQFMTQVAQLWQRDRASSAI